MLLAINLILVFFMLLAYLSNFISPTVIWPLAFFGLAYPVLLFLNLGFAIMWIWRRRWFFVISVMTILLGWNQVNRFIGFKKTTEHPVPDTTLSIVSYNVHVFNKLIDGRYQNTYDDVLRYLSELNQDIVCFQEFRSNYLLKNQNSVDGIGKQMNHMPYTHIHRTVGADKRISFGLAMYSKYPIVSKGFLPFPGSINGCIYSDIVFETDTIRIYNTHLQSIKLNKNYYEFHDSLPLLNAKRVDEIKDISVRLKNAYKKRAEQVQIISKHIEQSPYAVILCGDFNDTPVSYTYHMIEKTGLLDAHLHAGAGLGNTYLGEFPSLRIDYMFFSNSLGAANFEKGDIKASDHYPIRCEFWTARQVK